MKMERSSR